MASSSCKSPVRGAPSPGKIAVANLLTSLASPSESQWWTCDFCKLSLPQGARTKIQQLQVLRCFRLFFHVQTYTQHLNNPPSPSLR